jgi:ABC-type Mn2+/Zn2+ transport system ATPase subunit
VHGHLPVALEAKRPEPSAGGSGFFIWSKTSPVPGLAQAILYDPKVVILDEPMSELDPVGRREVRDIIQELKNEGKTVMFSTHILSDAEMFCDRVGVIVGSVRSPGPPSRHFHKAL